jgi:hypothetical protein
VIERGRARRPGLLLALAGGAAGLVIAACQTAPAAAPAASAASVPAPPVATARPTPAAAVTMLAPVGAGAAAVASVVPASSARGVEVVAGHPVVAAALDPTLLGSQGTLAAGRPVGEALGGVLLEGQAVQAELALEAGCYTAIGLSPSLSILEIELTAGDQPPRSVRSSRGTASLGEGDCVSLPAGPVRLRLTAVAGAGPVVGRLFRR